MGVPGNFNSAVRGLGLKLELVDRPNDFRERVGDLQLSQNHMTCWQFAQARILPSAPEAPNLSAGVLDVRRVWVLGDPGVRNEENEKSETSES